MNRTRKIFVYTLILLLIATVLGSVILYQNNKLLKYKESGFRIIGTYQTIDPKSQAGASTHGNELKTMVFDEKGQCFLYDINSLEKFTYAETASPNIYIIYLENEEISGYAVIGDESLDYITGRTVEHFTKVLRVGAFIHYPESQPSSE